MKEKRIVLCRHHSCFVTDGKVLPARTFSSMPEYNFACAGIYVQAFASTAISSSSANGIAEECYKTIQKLKTSYILIPVISSTAAVLARQSITNCEAEPSVADTDISIQTSYRLFPLSFFSFPSPVGAHSLSKKGGNANKLKQSVSRQATRTLLHHWSCKQKVAKPGERSPQKGLTYLSGLLSQFLCATAAFPDVAESLFRFF